MVLPMTLNVHLPSSCSGNSIARDRQGVMLLDMSVPKWAIHLVNDAWQKVTGVSQEMAAGGHFWDLFEPPAPAQVRLLMPGCFRVLSRPLLLYCNEKPLAAHQP